MEPFEVFDSRFARYTIPIVPLEKLHTGLRWAEGPASSADQRCLLFSDIPNNRIPRFDEQAEQITLFRPDSNFATGNTRDRQGRLVTCEHRGRRVTRTEHDGTITVLADRYEGKRLNSPNDVVVESDGTVWFTDPVHGISAVYEGGKAESEVGSCNVYRLDPSDGDLRIVVDDFKRPNGLASAPHESILYLGDSGFWLNPDWPHHIPAFDVADGRLANGRVFAEVSPGIPDDFHVDVDGTIWTSSGDGVRCIALDGSIIGRIPGAGEGRERVLRRPGPQSPLHLRPHLASRHPRQHAWRFRAVTEAAPRRRADRRPACATRGRRSTGTAIRDPAE